MLWPARGRLARRCAPSRRRGDRRLGADAADFGARGASMDVLVVTTAAPRTRTATVAAGAAGAERRREDAARLRTLGHRPRRVTLPWPADGALASDDGVRRDRSDGARSRRRPDLIVAPCEMMRMPTIAPSPRRSACRSAANTGSATASGRGVPVERCADMRCSARLREPCAEARAVPALPDAGGPDHRCGCGFHDDAPPPARLRAADAEHSRGWLTHRSILRLRSQVRRQRGPWSNLDQPDEALKRRASSTRSAPARSAGCLSSARATARTAVDRRPRAAPRCDGGDRQPAPRWSRGRCRSCPSRPRARVPSVVPRRRQTALRRGRDRRAALLSRPAPGRCGARGEQVVRMPAPGGTLVLAHHRITFYDFVQHAEHIHQPIFSATDGIVVPHYHARSNKRSTQKYWPSLALPGQTAGYSGITASQNSTALRSLATSLCALGLNSSREDEHGVIAARASSAIDDGWRGWLLPDKMEIRAHDWKPGPNIKWRTTMDQYIGLDVSLKDTAISIRQDGKRIWRGKCPSDPSSWRR